VKRHAPLLALICTLPLLAAGSSIGSFSSLGLQGWEEHSFKGHTQYRLVEQDGSRVLRAESHGTASGLLFETEVNLTQTPYMHWRWRVETVFEGIDERTKDGDDYPARVYVVKKGGLLPWRTRALDYVWSSNQPQGSSWPNAFTDKAQMIALHSGRSELGRWVEERVNVREDFRRRFGEEITRVDLVAIMTDSDNSGGQAAAYYGDIYFSRD
jgi:hypothetical protein